MAEEAENQAGPSGEGRRRDGRNRDGQNSSRKPKVRIGPRNRRPDQPPPPAQSQQPARPEHVRQQNAPRPADPDANGARKKRRRRKGRKPEGEQQIGPARPQQQPRIPATGEVLPPVQDDMDEIPSGVFKVARPDSEAGETETDRGSTNFDASSMPGADSTFPRSDAPIGHGGNPRDRRKRKKRRDRPELPPVDKTRGFWWSEQWVRSFEMLFPSNASRSRLAKGRTYARRGQVLELEVGPNGVLARVQGSRPRPYQVRLELNRLRRETWGRILHHVAGKAAFLAQLLEGNLPVEIEELFFASGARLFPHGDNDIRARCNCPDPVAPCKHVAALNYALAEALQRDPFLLFALRGKSRDQFLQDLRDMRGRDRQQSSGSIEEDLAQFWRMGRLAESVLRPVPWNLSADPARLVQSLGEPDLEGIREGAFLSLMESTYRQVSEAMRRLPKDV
jgi:uncharacterized Zn finger protein